jgi:predicted regulator of Ras-like GTPase activity (Roadblock/LC7/MglB family)
MFSNFKKIFARIAGSETDSASPAGVTLAAEQPADLIETPQPAPASSPPRVSAPASPPRVSAPSRQSSELAADLIQIPLRAIIQTLPAGLKTKVRTQPDSDATLRVARTRINDQLSLGHVRITWAELVEGSPQDAFIFTPGQESIQVDLPLREIIPQLGSKGLARKAAQRKVEIPPVTLSVFGAKGQVLHQPAPQSERRQTAIPSRTPAITPVVQPIQTLSSARLPTPTAAASPAQGNGPKAMRVAFTPPTPTVAEPTPRPATAETDPLNGNGSVFGKVATEERSLQVKIELVMGGWPEPVLQEITRLQLAGLSAALPMQEIDQAMKKGRLAFTWRQIRGWIKRVPPVTAASPHDDVRLELPLSTIVPLFLAQQTASLRRRVDVAEHIPDVFNGPPGAARNTNHQSAQVTNVSAPSEPNESVPVGGAVEPAGGLGKIFGQTYSTSWTPADVVQKTGMLSGVSGTAVSLEDGFLVASRMPPTLNAEVLAAFLPQIFSRVGDYSQELRLGQPTQLLVHFDNVPLAAFKSGKVFLAVLGREGAPLPMNQLNAVAAHLGQQSA